MSNEFLDFNDVDIKPTYKNKYKAVKGEKHRIGIIWPKAEGGPFVMQKTHYCDKYFVCTEGVCCDKLGPAKNRLACLVVKYKTKKDGTLVKGVEHEGIPFDFEIMEWNFTDAKFNQLKTLHGEWDLRKHDILIELDAKGKEQFQNITLTPAQESLWQHKDEFKEVIWAETEAIRPNLQKSLGQTLSNDEIKELLGLEVATPTDVISDENQLKDILQEM